MPAQEPPGDVVRQIAAKAGESKAARDHYTYRQAVLFQELDPRGGEVGSYREVRDVIFSPKQERTEILVGRPWMSLKNLRLTDEDFRDVREVKPFVLTRDELPLYGVKFQGREAMDGMDCFVYRLTPRQILDGQRLFDGMIWVSEKELQIVRAEGRPVPQIYRSKGENLFPHFTTLYRPIDGVYWFPVRTIADDTLHFRSGPQRVRLTIRYDEYKRFTAETTIQFK
ncbi:MAG: hypothetical protein HY238_20745 [Acidobacteria bacterium]|nr:hypothetical protein [Acidobacteriota bacterium]